MNSSPPLCTRWFLLGGAVDRGWEVFVFYVCRSVSFLSARCLFGGLAATASAQEATFSADSERLRL